MKILIFSDSHGKTTNLRAVTGRIAPDISYVLHLGDNLADLRTLQASFPSITMHGVPGNCDYSGYDTPQDAVIECGGKRIWMVHGHQYNVKADSDRLPLAAEVRDVDVCLYGHTHVAALYRRNGILYMNPGSIDFPRGYEKNSYGILTVESDGTTYASVVEAFRDKYRIIHSI